MDLTLHKVTQICAALPAATCERMGGHAKFLVAKKTFAYFLNSHHSDGIISICCKVMPGDNTRLAATGGAPPGRSGAGLGRS